MNHTPEIKAEERRSMPNLAKRYYFFLNSSPSISSVLMAKKVPADKAKNTAEIT